MNPPYDEMPFHEPRRKQEPDLVLDDRVHWYAITSNTCAPRKPDDRDPAGDAADVVVADAVPLGIAPQQRGADQHAGRDDHAERLDRRAIDPRSKYEPMWKCGRLAASDKAAAYMRGWSLQQARGPRYHPGVIWGPFLLALVLGLIVSAGLVLRVPVAAGRAGAVTSRRAGDAARGAGEARTESSSA